MFLAEVEKIKSPMIRGVRGRGLWIALELNEPARPYCVALMKEGILCKETHGNIIRLAPPLTITHDEILWAVERIRRVVGTADIR